jgi:gas vesicle protein
MALDQEIKKAGDQLGKSVGKLGDKIEQHSDKPKQTSKNAADGLENAGDSLSDNIKTFSEHLKSEESSNQKETFFTSAKDYAVNHGSSVYNYISATAQNLKDNLVGKTDESSENEL